MSNKASITGAWKGYDVQVVSLQPGDVMLVHIDDYLDVDDCNHIMKMLEETFPNNKCLLINEHIVKSLTIVRNASSEKVSDTVDIATNVNIDELFEQIMRGNKNDFLY